MDCFIVHMFVYLTGCNCLADVLAQLDSPSIDEVSPLFPQDASYNYLLLDPTKLQRQPIGEVQRFDDFVEAVFYVGNQEAKATTSPLKLVGQNCYPH